MVPSDEVTDEPMTWAPERMPRGHYFANVIIGIALIVIIVVFGGYVLAGAP